jgi:polar amino acid transport system substrate-binding protein
VTGRSAPAHRPEPQGAATMKRIVLAALTLAALHSTALAADDSLAKVKQKGTLVLGLDDAFPPMGFRNEDNQIVGYDIDLAKEVAKRLGVKLVPQPIDWNAKEQELNTAKIDCIWNGFTITDERKKAMAFTKPYLRNAQVVVVKKGSGYSTLASLKGKQVGLQAGSSAADALEAATAFRASLKNVVEFKDNLTALMDLEARGVDAVVMDLIVAEDNIKRSGKAYAVLQESLAPEVFGVGFRKNDLALRDAVQGALEAMAADGTLAKVTTRWFGSDISVVGK